MTGTPKSPATATVVAATPKGWVVRQTNGRTTSVHETQSEAITAARNLLRPGGGTLRVHGVDGQVRESLTLGRGSIARINAVEGLHPPSGFHEDLVEFDRLALSADDRRRQVARTYGG